MKSSVWVSVSLHSGVEQVPQIWIILGVADGEGHGQD